MSHVTVTKKQLTIIFSSLGDYSRRKQWFNFRCPYHNGTRFNFGVDIGAGIFKCLGCAEEGGLLRLYIDLKRGGGGGTTWGGGLLLPPEAAEVADGTSSPVRGRSERVDHTRNTQDFDQKYVPCSTLTSEPSRALVAARQYLNKRRVNWIDIDVGIHKDLPGRVVFPFRRDGQVVYYMGRAFENIPLKTVNPDSEKGWLHKSDVLWRLPAQVERIIICEGIFDAANLIHEGKGVGGGVLSMWHPTCLLGKTISTKQIQIIKSCNPKKVMVMLDSDADKDARSVGLRLYESGLETWVCQWGDVFQGKDPGDAPIWQLNDLMAGAKLITPELEFQWLLESA